MFGLEKVVAVAVALAALAVPSLALADDWGHRDVRRDEYARLERLRAQIEHDRFELARAEREHRWVEAREERREIRQHERQLRELRERFERFDRR